MRGTCLALPYVIDTRERENRSLSLLRSEDREEEGRTNEKEKTREPLSKEANLRYLFHLVCVLGCMYSLVLIGCLDENIEENEENEDGSISLSPFIAISLEN